MRALLVAIPLLVLLDAADDSGPTWQRSYFFDQAQSDFNVAGFACPSRKVCIAVGMVEQNIGRPHPWSVITRDGGEHWTPAKSPAYPVSLFFLNDTTGWVVTTRDIWNTRDAGQTWKKMRSGQGYIRVFFTDPLHGWLVGGKRVFEETSDGGSRWVGVPDAAKLAGAPSDVTFEYVHFSDPLHGTVVAEVAGRPDHSPPAWVDPEMARYRPPPSGGVSAGQTVDGGRTWTWGSVGLYQSLITAAFPAADHGWLVFAPDSPTQVYSEVTERNWSAWTSTTLFHLDGARISDMDTGPDGSLVVAAVQVPGKLAETPVPGKVRILSGDGFSTLREESVDYRAVARRIMLAHAGSEWFAATDTGMILRRKR
ncbi:MAG: YCF48-related protein [Bryobacteraceae bacterium]